MWLELPNVPIGRPPNQLAHPDLCIGRPHWLQAQTLTDRKRKTTAHHPPPRKEVSKQINEQGSRLESFQS